MNVKISNEQLNHVQEKIGNVVSNIAQTHAFGMLETCEQLAALNTAKAAVLDVPIKLKIRRETNGKYSCWADIQYDYRKRVKDGVDKVILIDPDPNLPNVDDNTDADRDDEDKAKETPKRAVPQLPPPIDIEATTPPEEKKPELQEAEIYEDADDSDFEPLFEAVKRSILKDELEQYLKHIGGIEKLTKQAIDNIRTKENSCAAFVKDVKKALYPADEPAKEEKKRGRKKKDTPTDTTDSTSNETPESDGNKTPETKQDGLQVVCGLMHPCGAACALTKGHTGEHKISSVDLPKLRAWEAEQAKKKNGTVTKE